MSQRPQTTIIGMQILWGVPKSIKPIFNLPALTKLIVMFSPKDCVRAVIETDHGVEVWAVLEKEGHWELSAKIAPRPGDLLAVGPPSNTPPLQNSTAPTPKAS